MCFSNNYNLLLNSTTIVLRVTLYFKDQFLLLTVCLLVHTVYSTYSAWPYIRSFILTPYLNLTTTLLIINKQQIRSLLKQKSNTRLKSDHLKNCTKKHYFALSIQNVCVVKLMVFLIFWCFFFLFTCCCFFFICSVLNSLGHHKNA